MSSTPQMHTHQPTVPHSLNSTQFTHSQQPVLCAATYAQDGMCVVTSQVLTTPDTGRQHSCGGSKTSTAVVLRFPCQEEARLKQAAGPALNVWGSFDGVPQPTRTGIIVNEAAPAAARRQSATVHASAAKLVDAAAAGDANNSANATQPATNGTAPIKGNCSFLTVSPGLYFHRSPPMFTYGYVVSGLPCQQAASALATTQALEKAGGARTFATTYSMWLKPTLPAVSCCCVYRQRCKAGDGDEVMGFASLLCGGV